MQNEKMAAVEPKKMSATKAAADVLAEGPMHYRAITEAVVAKGLWTSKSKTPAATMNATLSVAAKQGSTFERVAPGVFGLKVETEAEVNA